METRSRGNTLDYINDIEEKYPVDHWMIHRIHVWPLLRISLAMQLFRQNINNEGIINKSKMKKANDYTKRVAKLGRMSYLNYSNRYKNINKTKTDYLFIGDQVSRIWLNDVWYDRFCDPFMEQLDLIGEKCMHMEPRYDARSPGYRPTIYLQPKLDFLRVKSLINKPYTANNLVLDDYDYFANEIHSRFPDLDGITNSIPRQMDFMISISAYFEKILSTLKPKAVFIVEYYNTIAMSIIFACKRLNIPTIDIQHGVQGDLHIAYGRWKKVPGHGFNLLPDYFWVWSESEAKAIDSWRLENNVGTHKPFAGGNLWLEMWNNDETNLVMSYDEVFKKNIKIDNNNTLILFTLQPLTFDEKYPEWIIDAINHSPKNWIWLIRLHPCMLQDKEKVKEFFVRDNYVNIEVNVATDQPLPIILRNVDVHITSFSSTVVEAQDFGVYSVVVDDRGEEYYKREIEIGWVIPAHNKKELIKAIHTQSIKKKKVTMQHNKHDATAIIRNFIDLIENDFGGSMYER